MGMIVSDKAVEVRKNSRHAHLQTLVNIVELYERQTGNKPRTMPEVLTAIFNYLDRNNGPMVHITGAIKYQTKPQTYNSWSPINGKSDCGFSGQCHITIDRNNVNSNIVLFIELLKNCGFFVGSSTLDQYNSYEINKLHGVENKYRVYLILFCLFIEDWFSSVIDYYHSEIAEQRKQHEMNIIYKKLANDSVQEFDSFEYKSLHHFTLTSPRFSLGEIFVPQKVPSVVK